MRPTLACEFVRNPDRYPLQRGWCPLAPRVRFAKTCTRLLGVSELQS